MGLRDLSDPRSTLVAQFARVVAEVRPKAFVMENVPGMRTGKSAAIFEDVIERFSSAGYEMAWPPRRLNAKDFGVPQDRERLILIGTRRDLRISVQYPTGPCRGQPPRPTVLDAISDLPAPASVGDRHPYPDLPVGVSEYALVARGLRRDRSDWSRERDWDKQTCTGCAPVVHSDAVIALYAATPPGQMVPGHKLPRLAPDGISPTLRAGSNSERGSHTAPRPVHPVQPRCITVREAARLHGYPDWFLFYPGKWHAYQQIGNSVCPPLARAVGSKLMEALGVQPRKPKGALIALSTHFELSAKGTQHRRIVQVEVYSKVLAELVARRGIGDGTVYGVGDVQRAYEQTGVLMPRVRPEQFFAALSRSRNVRRLLRPFHHSGVTLRLCGEQHDSAEIVPLGTSGSIEDKDAVNVTSASLLEATRLHDVYLPGQGTQSIPLKLLADQRIIGLLGRERWKGLRPNGGLFFDDQKRMCTALAQNGRRFEKVLVTTCVGHQLPARSRLADGMVREECKRALVAARLTNQHLFLASFGLESGHAVERDRVVVRFANGDDQESTRAT